MWTEGRESVIGLGCLGNELTTFEVYLTGKQKFSGWRAEGMCRRYRNDSIRRHRIPTGHQPLRNEPWFTVSGRTLGEQGRLSWRCLVGSTLEDSMEWTPRPLGMLKQRWDAIIAVVLILHPDDMEKAISEGPGEDWSGTFCNSTRMRVFKTCSKIQTLRNSLSDPNPLTLACIIVSAS